MTRHPTSFLLYANGRPSTDLDKLGALVQTEADKLVSDGPTAKELNRVKKVCEPRDAEHRCAAGQSRLVGPDCCATTQVSSMGGRCTSIGGLAHTGCYRSLWLAGRRTHGSVDTTVSSQTLIFAKLSARQTA